jgi:hypothetical protein
MSIYINHNNTNKLSSMGYVNDGGIWKNNIPYLKTNSIWKPVHDETTDIDLTGYTSIYVDANIGNDISGDGSIDNPYKTIDKACPTGADKIAIILGNGYYPMINLIDKNIQDLIIIGNENNTIIYLYNTLTRENATNYSWIGKLKIYKLVLYGGGQTGTNFHTVKNLGTEVDFYNVVFRNIPLATYGYFTVNNNAIVRLCNCVAYLSNILLRTYGNLYPSGPNGTIQLTNCYGNYTAGYETEVTDFDYQTNIITDAEEVDATSSLTDSTYRLTGSGWEHSGTGLNPDGTQAHIGVYGGPYAWPE